MALINRNTTGTKLEIAYWNFDYDISQNSLSLKNRLIRIIKKYSGFEPGYNIYRLI